MGDSQGGPTPGPSVRKARKAAERKGLGDPDVPRARRACGTTRRPLRASSMPPRRSSTSRFSTGCPSAPTRPAGGKGGILLSDKEPGPELELTRLSRDLWDEADEELGPDTVELEAKGGLGCSTQGRAVMGAMNAQNAVAHPEDPAIDVCHHVFLEAPGSTAGHSRHAVAVHPGWFGVLHRLPLHRPDPGRDHGRRAARRTARHAHMPGRRTADRPTTRRDISGRMVK